MTVRPKKASEEKDLKYVLCNWECHCRISVKSDYFQTQNNGIDSVLLKVQTRIDNDN